MDTTGRGWSVVYLAIALFLALALVAGGDGTVPVWRNFAVGLAAAVFAVSAVPAVREHRLHSPVEYAAIAAVFGAQAVDGGSAVVGVFAVLIGVGAVVELYNWRTGSELLRFD